MYLSTGIITMKKRIRAKGRSFTDVLKHFIAQDIKGITKIRHNEMKEWAKKHNMSFATMQKELTKLIKFEFINKEEKIINGHLAVFYYLDKGYRRFWLSTFQDFISKAERIPSLKGQEKKEQIKEMISETISHFAHFVPWLIWYTLKKRPKKRPTITTDEIQEIYNNSIYQYLYITLRMCIQNSDDVLELDIIKDMNVGYNEFLKSEDYRSTKKKMEMNTKALQNRYQDLENYVRRSKK